MGQVLSVDPELVAGAPDLRHLHAFGQHTPDKQFTLAVFEDQLVHVRALVNPAPGGQLAGQRHRFGDAVQEPLLALVALR
ncbi:MAG: hypothetical protein AMK75_06940 [Planctomycetes bacterium SM23_65]|nr:MAG: hypothetical protein AMK75_06940 [Planctomycetes bacterium SM23_65]